MDAELVGMKRLRGLRHGPCLDKKGMSDSWIAGASFLLQEIRNLDWTTFHERGRPSIDSKGDVSLCLKFGRCYKIVSGMAWSERDREFRNTWSCLPSFSSWRLNPVAIRVILT